MGHRGVVVDGESPLCIITGRHQKRCCLHPITRRRKRCSMSSTCFQGSGTSPSGFPEQGVSERSVSAKSTPPATPCCNGASQGCQSTKTSPSCAAATCSSQTCSAAAHRAKMFPSPERAPDCAESAPDSGSSTCVSSKRRTPNGSSSKTLRPFALADWKKFSGASLRSGILLDGTVFPQAPLAPITKETGSGLLPTVRASEYKGCGPRGSRSHTHWLNHFYLSAIVTDSGKLSPMFAERLMGMPQGWTDV